MIDTSDLNNRMVPASCLSDRQQEVATLVRQYIAVAREFPSAGWLSRRLNISRQRAYEHLRVFRERTLDKMTRS